MSDLHRPINISGYVKGDIEGLVTVETTTIPLIENGIGRSVATKEWVECRIRDCVRWMCEESECCEDRRNGNQNCNGNNGNNGGNGYECCCDDSCIDSYINYTGNCPLSVPPLTPQQIQQAQEPQTESTISEIQDRALVIQQTMQILQEEMNSINNWIASHS